VHYDALQSPSSGYIEHEESKDGSAGLFVKSGEFAAREVTYSVEGIAAEPDNWNECMAATAS
jgi:hypothetical protein